MDKINQKAVAHLQEKISLLLNKPVHLTITDNTYSMIRMRPSTDTYRLRLHHMFLEADVDVLDSLAHLINSQSKKARSVLRDFIAANSNKVRRSSRRPRRTVLCSTGRYFDLKTLFDEVNREYFDGRVDCAITWGANRRVRKQNTVKLGSYSDIKRIIRVNPVLDRRNVPKYFIKGIIYHEMLHHDIGVETRNGRKIAHSKTFRQLESRYLQYSRMQAWKDKNLHRLLGRH